MSIALPGFPVDESGAAFVFTAENRAAAEKIITKYPAGRQASAVLSLLHLAQRQNDGWISQSAMTHVAAILEMPPIRVYEIGTFYTMFNLRPVGKYLLQVCRTTPCWLRGSDDITAACKQHGKVEIGGNSTDGLFTLVEVECLGACVNAPVLQINDDYYEDVDAKSVAQLITACRNDMLPPPGSMIGRQGSGPIDHQTTLLSGQPVE